MSGGQLYQRIASDAKLGQRGKIFACTNLYSREISADSKIGTLVETQKGARVGGRCKISSHTFICEGVNLEDEVFVGQGVTFINDRFPHTSKMNGRQQTETDWKCDSTTIRRGALIGSGATKPREVTIGVRAIVGAGNVVTKNVPEGGIVAGNPVRILHRQNRV